MNRKISGTTTTKENAPATTEASTTTRSNSNTESQKLLTPKFDTIPPTLKAIHQWVLWALETRDGKPIKVPKSVRGISIDVTKRDNWASFEAVKAAYESKPAYFSGVGIVLAGKPIDEQGRYLIGLDFDKCIHNGEIDAFAQEAIKDFDTYTELSPSGSGLRMFCLHDSIVPTRKVNVNGASREIYSDLRYLTVTGHSIGDREVNHVR